MKKFTLLSAFAFVCLLQQSVFAQYTIDLDFNHKRHLLYESIPCDLRIKNETSRLLHVNDPKGGAEVKVRVWDNKRNLIGETGTPLVKGRMLVPPNQIVKTPLDLVHSFRIREPGSYYAVVDLSIAGKRFVSPKLYFEVVGGAEIKKLISYTPPRLFSLRLINRGEGDELLLRVQSEDKSLCYGVYPLGFTMRSYKARMQMDSHDVVHVLHRASPREFLHFQFTTSGAPVTHNVLESRLPTGPDLVRGPSGALIVEGAIQEDLAEGDTPLAEPDLAPQPDLADLPEESLAEPLPATSTVEERDVEAENETVIPSVPVPDFLTPSAP